MDFYVTLKVSAENMREANKIAEGISMAAEYPIEAVYPGFNAQLDDNGQVVIHTGYTHPSHGA